MVFERRKVNQEKPKTYFWTISKWYWFIIPSIYYIMILPNLVMNDGASVINVDDMFTMLLQFSSYIMSGLMFGTNPMEQSKSGVADKLLKIAGAQQFIVRNIYGVILAFLAWYQLPNRVNPDLVDSEDMNKGHLKPKTILILSVVSISLSILSMIGQLS